MSIFKTKLASAFGGALGGFMLSWVGYIPHTVQSYDTALWIALFFTIIPGVVSLLSLIPLSKYEITEKRFFELLKDIRQRDGNKNSADPQISPTSDNIPLLKGEA